MRLKLTMLGQPQLDRCCTTDKSNAQHPVRGSQNPHGHDPFRLRAALAVGPISKITGTHAAVRVVDRRRKDAPCCTAGRARQLADDTGSTTPPTVAIAVHRIWRCARQTHHELAHSV